MSQFSLFKDDTYTPSTDEFKQILKDEFIAKKSLPPLKTVKKSSKADRILLPEGDNKKVVLSLAETLPHVSPYYPPGVFPKISTFKSDVINNLRSPDQRLGLDFEFSTKNYRPQIIGVSRKDFTAACRWDEDIAKELLSAVESNKTFVGHFVLGADKEVLEKGLGIQTFGESWEDSMILHYLCAASLCKNPTKTADGEGGLGFMSLGFAAALWTDLPSWKGCRGVGCSGPCPYHHVFQYCAVDAWAGLEIADKCWEFMNEKGIPRRVYDEHAELALDFCIASEKKGIDVNRPLVAVLEDVIEKKKEALFPHDNEKFNPRSNIQVLKWMNENGIKLSDTQKPTIQTELSRRLERYTSVPLEDFDDPSILEEPDKTLFDLFTYKNSGKGLKPWFDDKYFDNNDKIHPRFVFTGASTMRLSSSSPNLQNVKSGRGWGKEVKKCIIPPKGKIFVSSDASNLEFRICMQNAGVDAKDIPKDAFTWLVEQSKGGFKSGADRLGWSERDLSKMVSHGSNYLAGLRLYEPYEIGTRTVQEELGQGALLLFEDWIYHGKIVAFTGIRMAQALYNFDKSDSYAAKIQKRKDTLALQKIYFDTFPIRSWHRSLLKSAEKGYIQTRWGSYLELIEDELENAKIAAAKIGQGEGAEYVQGMQLEYLRNLPPDVDMIAQVHDEILFAVPNDWSIERIKKFVAPLSNEYSYRLPGFVCPWSTKVGPNWGEVVKIETL